MANSYFEVLGEKPPTKKELADSILNNMRELLG